MVLLFPPRAPDGLALTPLSPSPSPVGAAPWSAPSQFSPDSRAPAGYVTPPAGRARDGGCLADQSARHVTAWRSPPWLQPAPHAEIPLLCSAWKSGSVQWRINGIFIDLCTTENKFIIY